MDKERNSLQKIETTAPKNKELSIQPTYDALDDFQETFPGDSVDEYKSMESANKQIGKDEIEQQKNNL